MKTLKPKCDKCWGKGWASWAYGSEGKTVIVKKFCTCPLGKKLGKGKRYEN